MGAGFVAKINKNVVLETQKSEALMLPAASMSSRYLMTCLAFLAETLKVICICCKTHVAQVVMVVEFHMPETAHFALQGVYYIFAVITSPGGGSFA